MIKRRKIFLVTTLIIIVALAIVFCVGLLNEGKTREYEGTLVETYVKESNLL